MLIAPKKQQYAIRAMLESAVAEGERQDQAEAFRSELREGIHYTIRLDGAE